MQHIDKADTSMTFFVYLQPTSMICFGAESKILIKSGDTIITVNLSGDIDCAGQGSLLIDYGSPTPEDIEYLKTHYIEAIRLHFTEGYGDYNIKKTDYFIKTLKCFE